MSPDQGSRGTLELRAVSKRFVAGAGSCSAGVTALRDASIEIRAGEVAIVAGPAGAGKTTLLLCAAGLLRCDSGAVMGSARRVIYRDLSLVIRPVDPITRGAVVLLDSCDALPDLGRAPAIQVVAEAVATGAAVVLAAREARDCLALVPPAATVAIIHLRLGRTLGVERMAPTRVAEGGARY